MFIEICKSKKVFGITLKLMTSTATIIKGLSYFLSGQNKEKNWSCKTFLQMLCRALKVKHVNYKLACTSYINTLNLQLFTFNELN